MTPKYSVVKKIRKYIKNTDNSLKNLIFSRDKYASDIEKTEEKLRKTLIEKKLKELDVDELSKAKQGIRVSVLKNAGIENIYQLSKMSFKNLEDINGIGSKGAASIIVITKQIVKSVENNTTVRIDPDEQDGLNDDFVKKIYAYRKSSGISDEASKIYDSNHERVMQLLKESAPAQNWFLWKLSSEDKQERAIESLRELKALIKDGYGSRTEEMFDEEQSLLRAKHQEYWGDFARNAAGYYATVDRVKHGKKTTGKSDKEQEIAIKNGLPEELAVAIGNVEVNLDGMSSDCSLRYYQKYGVQYILNQGAVLLGDEMGLGKTVEAIASMVALRNTGKTHFLVVCPLSVLINWIREIEKFCDIPTYKIHSTHAVETYEKWIKKGGVGVTTYETLGKLYLNSDFAFDMLIVDEAHYIKNPLATRTLNLVKFRQHTDRVLFMTGTPIENNVEEMCFLISCLKPSVAKTIQGSTSLAMASEFRQKISTVYFRRTKEDVLDELPEKTEIQEWVELTDPEIKDYRYYVYEGSFSNMRQVSWLVEKPKESSKGIRLKEIVDEYISHNRKIIVFSFFLNTIEVVQDILEDYEIYGPITGSIAPQKRQEIIDNFSEAENGAVLLSQIQAGGTGLNIQAASVIIFCEPQLKPSIENQAIARAYRMGQVNRVMVHRLLCDNTVDERIMNILENKQVLFDNFADISESGKESVISSASISDILESEKERLSREV